MTKQKNVEIVHYKKIRRAVILLALMTAVGFVILLILNTRLPEGVLGFSLPDYPEKKDKTEKERFRQAQDMHCCCPARPRSKMPLSHRCLLPPAAIPASEGVLGFSDVSFLIFNDSWANYRGATWTDGVLAYLHMTPLQKLENKWCIQHLLKTDHVMYRISQDCCSAQIQYRLFIGFFNKVQECR